MQRPAERSPLELWLAFALLAAGSALWLTSVLRNPAALQMLPGTDACLVAGLVGALLALLHGVPYRVVILGLMVPIALIQLAACAAVRVSFVPMLGVEMAVLGLFGVVTNRATAPSHAAEGAQEQAAPGANAGGDGEQAAPGAARS